MWAQSPPDYMYAESPCRDTSRPGRDPVPEVANTAHGGGENKPSVGHDTLLFFLPVRLWMPDRF
jgi:hypothetical protein